MLAVTAHGVLVPGASPVDGGLTGPARARARDCLLSVLPEDMQARDSFAAYVEAAAAADARGSHAVYMSSMNRLVYAMLQRSTDAAAVLGLLCSQPCSALCRLSANDAGLTSHGDAGLARRPLEALAQTLLRRVESISQNVSEDAAGITTAALRDRCPKCKTTENIQKVLAQLRRGDEGMTTQCMCGRCGATWHAK